MRVSFPYLPSGQRGATCALLILGWWIALWAVGCSCACPDGESCTVSISNGGGFSGQWSGYTIDPDGGLRYWSRMRGVTEETAVLGHLDADRLRKLRLLIKDLDSTSESKLAGANYFSVLDAECHGKRLSHTWSGPYADSTSWPANVRSLCSLLLLTISPFEDAARNAPRSVRQAQSH